MNAAERVVLATANAGKVRELRELLAGAGLAWDVVPQTALAVPSPEETGTTFEANALLKARHAAERTGLPAVADDSGIEVDALGGRPGVRSARYAGPAATDAENNARLLEELAGVPAERRSARYRCAIVYVTGPRDAAPVVVEGRWEGAIAFAPRGSGGFGYDPLFVGAAEDPERGIALPPPPYASWADALAAAPTGAEMASAAKHGVSHRGRALRALVAALSAVRATA